MLSPHVMEHLRTEISKEDPWLLETKPFDQARYAAMLDMLGDLSKYKSILEVGCAAGSFTHYLASRAQRLRVVDVMREAIRKCRRRLATEQGVIFCVEDISETEGWGETYDLIVISEVLYYLESRDRIAEVVAKVQTWLTPDGELIFGSAIDSVSSMWGMPCGAETAVEEFSKYLHETERRAVTGTSLDEHSLIVKYRRDA